MSLRKGTTLISGRGIDGTNGVSPTASVGKVGSVSTLIVTDANGTTSTQILDGGQIIQYPVMPTATSETVGQIVQYTGTTDSTYINGYFYIGTTDGESTPTYSWENIQVQQGGNEAYCLNDFYDNNKKMATAQKIVDHYYKYNQFPRMYIEQDLGASNSVYYESPIITMGAYNSFARNMIFNIVFIDINPDSSGRFCYSIQLHFKIYFNEDTKIVSDVRYNYTSSGNFYEKYVVTTNNTYNYTPTVNSYNPATAKYAESMVEAIAPAYSSSSTYSVGDYVSYQGKLYKCNTAISTAESWTSAHWTQTTVVEIISNL